MLLEHNKEFYKQVKDMLLQYRECCFISAPGTGKSNIATEFIKEMGNLNALVISPKVAISDNWSDMPTKYGFAPTISTVTYQYFCKYYKELYGFDIYIFDEAHHAGASKWFNAIRNFRDRLTNEYVLGLTATPRRYSDKFKDVSDFVFHGRTVYGLDQKQAIQLGVIKNAIYVKSLYDTEPLFEIYRQKTITDDLRAKLDLSEKNCMSIVDTLKEHIQCESNIKGVLFVDNIKKTEDGISIINEAFPELQTYCVHSGISQKRNIKTLNAFKNAKSGFMVSVGMLDEGIHVPGVNVVILLRKTWSPTIFIQQIGRCLSTNGQISTIFDFVSNWKSVQSAINNAEDYVLNQSEDDIYSKDEKSIGDYDIYRSYSESISDLFIVKDNISDILSVLNEIDEYCRPSKPWTNEEIAILEEFYPIMGFKVIELLPGRTIASIHNRARIQNIYREKNWSQEEDQVLIANYEELGPTGILKLLPNKTKSMCMARALKYGIKYKYIDNKYHWTPEEDQILRDNYPAIGPDVYTLLQNRSRIMCKRRAQYLGIKMTNYREANWSPEEDRILIENYPTMGPDVYTLLQNRSKKSCMARAQVVKIIFKKSPTEWTPEEDQILRDNYPIMGKKVIELLSNKTINSCRNRAKKLGVIYARQRNMWTAEEDRILMDNYPAIGCEVYKLIPGRAKSTCISRATKLGLRVETERNIWTPEEIQILKENYPTMGAKVSSLLIGRTDRACVSKAKKLGLGVEAERRNIWTPEEDQILRDNYPTMGGNVSSILPKRNSANCISRAKKLGLRIEGERNIWTPEEDQILKENYPTMGGNVYKLLSRRTESACNCRAHLLGLKVDNAYWTPEEDQILKDNYPTMGYEVYKLIPGRTKSGCVGRARTLKIRVNNVHWTPEEDQIIRDNYPAMGSSVSSLLTGRTDRACKKRANDLGIRLPSRSWTPEDDQIIRDNYPAMGYSTYKVVPGRTKDAVVRRAMILGVRKIK